MKRNRFDCWSGFVAMLARRSGEANVRYPTECKIPYRRTLLGTFILHRILRISGVPVSHTRTGEFIPYPWRFFGSRLWRARNSKSCSLASGQMPQESPSATKYFYPAPIARTRRSLRPHLQYVRLPNHLVLHESGGKLEFAYFPNRGLISLVVVMKDGRTAEAGRSAARGAG